MTEKVEIVKKGSSEFKAVLQQYLKLMDESKQEDFVKRGILPDNKYLGLSSKRVDVAKLPMPFGCPNLFIQACFETIDKGKFTERNLCTGIIWFCDINGSICVCCREDFTGPQEEYPNYCPKFEVDDCTIHHGDCDACPNNCHRESEDPEYWEVEEWEGGFYQ